MDSLGVRVSCVCVKVSITGSLRGSDERIRECSHSDSLALYVPQCGRLPSKANIVLVRMGEGSRDSGLARVVNLYLFS